MSEVARCFGAAAADYDNHAQVQRWAAMHLLQRAKTAERWLDIGAGTGFVSARLPATQVVPLDLAMPMLRQNRGDNRLQADMQQLPLQSNSVDAVAANLSLQWSNDLTQCLQEAARVCRRGGQLLFTVPTETTFSQLQPLVEAGSLACNAFVTQVMLQQRLAQAGWHQVSVQRHAITLYFDSPKALLQHFKATGAQHASRRQGLRGRHWWGQICAHLQQHQTTQGLPLSWEIYLVEATR